MLTSDEVVRELMGKRAHRFVLGKFGLSDAYMRKALRVRAGLAIRTLDVADVFVTSQERRQGIFRSVMAAAEEAVPRLGLDAVFVECVVSQVVADELERRGYVRFEAGSAGLVQVDYVRLIASP